MKRKLVLSLLGDHFLMEVLEPSDRFSDVLRSMLHLRSAQSLNAPAQAMARVELAGKVTVESLRSNLDQAFSGLKTIYQGASSSVELEVQLGLDHAWIGLMVLADAPAARLSSGTCEDYARAWVKQMLHLDPSGQEIRWEIHDDAHKLLVSCVDARLVEVLTDFALEHGLRFASCRPAVLSAIHGQAHINAKSAPTSDTTVVWTDASTGKAHRSNSVQLLRFKGRQLASCWRGWVPAEALPADSALEGAIRRFQVRNLAPGGEVLTRVHWPALAAEAAPVLDGTY